MPRRARQELDGGMFHITARAVSNLNLFSDDEDRRAFLWLLGSVVANFRLTCHAYCLMGTHYHLLLAGEPAELSPAMKLLNGRYARRFNERHERRGHVFAERFSAYVIRDDQHFEEASRYVAENPVIAGLCMTAADWPWTWLRHRHGPWRDLSFSRDRAA